MIMNIFSSSMMIISILSPMMITSMIFIKGQGGKSYFFLASILLFRVSTSSQGSFIIVTFPSQLLLSSSSSTRPIDHNHHDDICQICLHRSQYMYVYQQDFICKVSFTYCLFLQILFCFLSQIFEIRSVCIDLRVGFAKHTETTFAFMAPLFAFHFASCNWYVCILE